MCNVNFCKLCRNAEKIACNAALQHVYVAQT